ncbi:hypothetical protein Acr_00g0069440 [Actinidia rufa]|uniref:Uncharacterized protein n=1 Tax=Actinidia rufa TaxID=165716 RepID=A0A7J0DR47_9ERIC|nr:hypothetical protein Acr_00g0069440 [Actinidia rufa]
MTTGKRAQRRVVELLSVPLNDGGAAFFIDGVMGRVHGSRRDPRKDKYGKISQRCRRHNLEDCHLESIRNRNYWCRGGENLAMGREETVLYLRSTDEYPDSGSGELSGDSLTRFHAERWIRFTSVKGKQSGRGRSKLLRRGDQTKAMTTGDIIGKIAIWRVSRNCWCRGGRESRDGRIDRILVEIDQSKYFTSPKSEEETALYLRSTDEYPDSGSGKLSGDSLTRLHAERWIRFTSVKRVRR